MHADNRAHLITAARRSRDKARQRAVDPLRAAQADDRRPSVSALAATAGVSQSLLYANPDVIQALQNLQQEQTDRASASKQASHKSLLARIAALTEKNKALRAEITDLRRCLEAAHGVLQDQRHGLVRGSAL